MLIKFYFLIPIKLIFFSLAQTLNSAHSICSLNNTFFIVLYYNILEFVNFNLALNNIQVNITYIEFVNTININWYSL